DDTGWFWWCDLKPGRYLLSAEYDPERDPRPAQPAWGRKVHTEAVAFEVLGGDAGLKRSGPERASGVEFQAAVEPQVPVPAAGGRQALDLGLRLTNGGDGTLLFNLFDTLWVSLRSADGKEFKRAGGRLRTAPAAPVLVGPGKTETVSR